MKPYLWPIVITLSALVMLFGIYIPPILRVPLAFWFLLVCPGMAFIRLFHFQERLAEWVLAIALSIAVDTIIAEIAVLNNVFSPAGILINLSALCAVGVILQIRGQSRQSRIGRTESYDVNNRERDHSGA